MPDTIPQFRPGEPIFASQVDLLRQEAERRQINVSGGLISKFGSFGTAIGGGDCACDALWILLTRSYGNGLYDWMEKVPTAGGGWHNGKSGTMNAREVNANGGVNLNTIVWGMFDPFHQYLLFQLSSC